MQRIQSGKQLMVWKAIQTKLYKEKGYTWLDFQGTRSSYTMPMIFKNVTKSGNVNVVEVMGTKTGGIPDSFRNRRAILHKRDQGYYLWIEDGTGSLICKLY